MYARYPSVSWVSLISLRLYALLLSLLLSLRGLMSPTNPNTAFSPRLFNDQTVIRNRGYLVTYIGKEPS